MKTNTTNNDNNNGKKGIAVAALIAVLAIGGGAIYLHDQRNINDGQDSQASITTTRTTTNTVPVAPVITTTDYTAQTAPAATISTRRVATTTKHRRTTIKKATIPANDQISVVTTESFGGNYPTAAPTPEQPKTVVTEKTKVTTTMVSTGTARKFGRVNIAPEAGGNLNSMYNNNSSNINTNGFHAGVMVNIELNDKFAIQPGVRYMTKGNEDKTTVYPAQGTEVNATQRTQLNYAEVPVNVVFKFGDTKGNPRFMVGAGPYVAYLVGAKTTTSSITSNSEGFTVNSSKVVTTNNTGMQRFDAGMGGFIGCQMPKGFYAKAGAQVGLMDVQPNAGRNFNALLTVGHIIGRKGKTY